MVSGDMDTAVVLYVLYTFIHSASCSAYQSEALPMRETKREENSLERTKTGTWENRHLGKYGVWIRDLDHYKRAKRHMKQKRECWN